MVSRKNRAQVNFEPRGPGLATKQAANVPFIPATRRTGVGDNARRMGSALSNLGSALGKFSARVGPSEADTHAERKRIEKKMHTASKHTPEQRADIRAKHGIHPVADGVKQITDVRENVVKGVTASLAKQTQEWQGQGWTTVDEDGARLPVTEKDINDYYTEQLQTQVYDQYKVKGEEGRLHAPQVNQLRGEILKYRAQALATHKAYKLKELSIDGYQSVESDAAPSLALGYQKGMQGQALLDSWVNSGRETYSAITGSPTYMKADRSTILKKQLEGYYRQMDTPGEVTMLGKILDARLSNGAKLRDSHQAIIGQLITKGNKILKRTLTNEQRQEHLGEALTELGTKGTYSFQDKNVVMGGKVVDTITRKQQKDAVLAKIKEDSKVAAGSEKDPSLRWMEHQRTIGALRGVDIIDPEIKDQFTNAAFGLAASNPEQLNGLMTLYRDIKTIDPTKLDRYIPDKSVQARLRNMERILDSNPAMGLEGALSVIQSATDEDGKIAPWSTQSPRIEKAWKDYKKSEHFHSSGLYGEDVETLDKVMRIKLNDPAIRRSFDTSDDGTLDAAEVRKAIEAEAEQIKSQQAVVNGTAFRPPPGEPADHYQVKVQSAVESVASELKVSSKDVRIRPLPQGAGIAFIDKNGKPIKLKRDGQEVNAVFSHQQILEWVKAKGEGDVTAKIIRQRGNSSLRKSVGDNLKKIEAARKSQAELKSWWSTTWLGGLTSKD